MITKEDYFYLTKMVGCAYRGEVEGLGTVMALPVIVANTTSAAQRDSIPKGVFLTTNYVSVIVPQQTSQVDNEIHDYEKAQYIKNKISCFNSDGSIDYLDVNTNQIHKLAKGGWINVDVKDNMLYIGAGDATHSFQQTIDLNFSDYMEKLEQAPPSFNFSPKMQEVPIPQQKKPFPASRTTYDASAITWNAIRWKVEKAKYVKGRPPIFNGIKREIKNKYLWDAKQFLKRRHIPAKYRTSDFIDRTLPKFYKTAGRVLLVVSIGFEILDIYNNHAIKFSHALDVGMLAVAAIPFVGWGISLAYFLTDAGLMIYNYNQTGNAKGIGDYVNELVDSWGWFDNGVIWDLTPLFGPTNDSIPIVNPGLTISF